MQHGEYSSYGVKHVPLAKVGDLVMVLTTLEGNLTVEQDGKKAFFVPDNAIVAIVSDLNLQEDSDDESSS
jgi:hypothetical protein